MKKSTELYQDPLYWLVVAILTLNVGLIAYGLLPQRFFDDFEGAAWVQAIGSVLAIVVGFHQSARARRFAIEDAELKEKRRNEGALVQIRTIAKRANSGFKEMRHYIGDTAPFDAHPEGHTYIDGHREAVATALYALQRIDVSGLEPTWLTCYISICRELGTALSAVDHARRHGGHENRKKLYIQSHTRFWKEGLDPIDMWVNERFPPKE